MCLENDQPSPVVLALVVQAVRVVLAWFDLRRRSSRPTVVAAHIALVHNEHLQRHVSVLCTLHIGPTTCTVQYTVRVGALEVSFSYRQVVQFGPAQIVSQTSGLTESVFLCLPYDSHNSRFHSISDLNICWYFSVEDIFTSTIMELQLHATMQSIKVSSMVLLLSIIRVTSRFIALNDHSTFYFRVFTSVQHYTLYMYMGVQQ